jgi:hypothetical protein
MRRFVLRTLQLVVAVTAISTLGGIALAQTPLTLRGGATPTGLWGYYDYQSNGMSPGWLYVERDNPERIHAVYMLSLIGTDTTQISASRRVGYAFSSDGGKTWSANREIEAGHRLGFPYLQVNSDDLPMIATHGVGTDNLGVRTMFYLGESNGTNFFRANEFPRPTSSGRTGAEGAGVIWPAFVINPKNPLEGIFIASLSNNTTEGAAPLQVSKAELGVSGAWSDFTGDSSITNTSGGRYVITTSPAGKIGVVTRSLGTSDLAGYYFSESTDGGSTFSELVKVFGTEFTDEFMLNGDLDTISPGTSVDLAYLGEEAQIVASGGLNGLFSRQRIYHWSSTNGLKLIVESDPAMGIGLSTAALTKLQPNMNFVDYPSLSIGDDGQHIVVPFMATAQDQSVDPPVQIASPEGFYYYRIGGIGSPDGGKSWGTPFLLQDFAGEGTDSASIEFPSANEVGHVANNEFEFSMAFQARRYPGMFAFVLTNIDGNNTPADRGPINPLYQYFQRTMLGPDKFAVQQASTGNTSSSLARLAFAKSYPNPASSQLTVEYSVPTSGDVTLAVYNTLGSRVLIPVNSQSAFAGSYTKVLDVSGLPAGPYRLVLTQNGGSVSQDIKVVR